jgi:uncharacterized protein with NRDE domain
MSMFRKLKLDSYFSQCNKKINSKWFKILDVRPEILKLLQEEKEKHLNI